MMKRRTIGFPVALAVAGSLWLAAGASAQGPVQNDQGQYCKSGATSMDPPYEFICDEWGTPVTDAECENEWLGSYAYKKQQCTNWEISAVPISVECEFKAECCYAAADSVPPPQCQPNSPWVATDIFIEQGHGWKVCVTGVGEFQIQGLGRGC